MEAQKQKTLHFVARNPSLFTVAFFVVLGLAGYDGYLHYKLYGKNVENLNTIQTLETNLKTTEGNLASARTENEGLRANLVSEQTRNNEFANQINSITSNVGTLVKLSKTDKELLQKYSKVYFLNENYVPSNLTGIDPRFNSSSDKNKILQVHTNAWPFLSNLLNSATGSGINLQVVSAYRSFGTQASLKQSYKFTYGAGTANTFSAEQGYSEHQLGTAIDFTVPSIGGSLSGFDEDPAFAWLNANAYRYGFVLSYPKQNTYYQFEPWHWRFVGVALATKLHNEGKNFYDLEQRVIDEYLVNIFD